MTQRLEFEIIDHGCDGEQYFPGCGVAFTRFEYCATGIGDSAREAAEDAAEQLYWGDLPPHDPTCLHSTTYRQGDPCTCWRDAFDRELNTAIGELSGEDDTDQDPEDPNPEWHHYVSIRWRIVEGA